MVYRSLILSLATAAGLLAASCGPRRPGASTTKDDYIAAGVAEFTVTGSDYVTLEPEYAAKSAAERQARAQVLATQRSRAVGFFLKAYVEDKEEDDANVDYGKFNAEVRFGLDASSSVQAQQGLNYSFNFSFQVAGYTDTIQRINADQHRKADDDHFIIQTADLSNAVMAQLKIGKEWYRDEPYQSFNPSTYTLPKRNVEAAIVAQKSDTDAYLPFDALAASGKIQVAVHYGWDGETPPGPDGIRNDIVLARQLYTEFVQEGFTAPAASAAAYQPYAEGTAPLKKTIVVNGKQVEVDLYIYFAGQPAAGVAGPDPETEAGAKVLLDQLVHSFAVNQVVSYLGHSGIGAGFNMADWDSADGGTLTPPMVKKMAMLPTYQLVLVDGCQTYYLADWFWQNLAKAHNKNLNLITSLGFTDAASSNTIVQVVKALTTQDHGKMVAPRVANLLSALNPPLRAGKTPSDVFSAGADGDDADPLFPVYGMHGIDANPKFDPLALPASLGKACSNASDCGGDGAWCTAATPGAALSCTFGCTADAGCGAGYRCRQTGSMPANAAGICTKQ